MKIVDSIMGSGKTEYIINMMLNNPQYKYLYITPYLDEINDRILPRCKSIDMMTPIFNGKNKKDNLFDLIYYNQNIATTHELFKQFDPSICQLLKSKNYILILDEALDVVEQYPIAKADIDLLCQTNTIEIDENNIVNWISENYKSNEIDKKTSLKFQEFKRDVLNGNIICINNILFYWQFPVKVFKLFKESYILTYNFKYQIQKYYFDKFNVQYEYNSIKKIDNIYQLVDFYDITLNEKLNIKSLITIVEGKINDIGERNYSLSMEWFKNKNGSFTKDKSQLKKNLLNYFYNICKESNKTKLWTVFSDYKDKFKDKGYSAGFLSCNTRATNNYSDRYNLAYCINKCINPLLKQYFDNNNISINEDGYALTEMLQWIWRSSIRNGEKIKIYIPSKRMREILNKWLNNEL